MLSHLSSWWRASLDQEHGCSAKLKHKPPWGLCTVIPPPCTPVRPSPVIFASSYSGFTALGSWRSPRLDTSKTQTPRHHARALPHCLQWPGPAGSLALRMCTECRAVWFWGLGFLPFVLSTRKALESPAYFFWFLSNKTDVLNFLSLSFFPWTLISPFSALTFLHISVFLFFSVLEGPFESFCTDKRIHFSQYW